MHYDAAEVVLTMVGIGVTFTAEFEVSFAMTGIDVVLLLCVLLYALSAVCLTFSGLIFLNWTSLTYNLLSSLA